MKTVSLNKLEKIFNFVSLVAKSNSIRGFVRPWVRRSVGPSVRRSRVSWKPQIQVNSTKFSKIHDFSQLLAKWRPCYYNLQSNFNPKSKQIGKWNKRDCFCLKLIYYIHTLFYKNFYNSFWCLSFLLLGPFES